MVWGSWSDLYLTLGNVSGLVGLRVGRNVPYYVDIGVFWGARARRAGKLRATAGKIRIISIT